MGGNSFSETPTSFCCKPLSGELSVLEFTTVSKLFCSAEVEDILTVSEYDLGRLFSVAFGTLCHDGRIGEVVGAGGNWLLLMKKTVFKENILMVF